MTNGYDIVKPNWSCAKKKKKNCNKVCHVCQLNLRIKYSNIPSLRSGSFDVIWEKKLTDGVGNNTNNRLNSTQLAFTVCIRKN